MRVTGAMQIVMYEHYVEAVQNKEDIQQAVKRKWEDLMIENRKLGEAEDEVQIFHKTHNKMAVLATTTELATRAVPNQRLFIEEQEAFDDSGTPEQMTYNQSIVLTPEQEKQLVKEMDAMQDWVMVLKKNSGVRITPTAPMSGTARSQLEIVKAHS